MKFLVEMTVWSVETIHIGACDYPVLRIDNRHQFSDLPVSTTTNYYHQASMMTLRSVIEIIPPTPDAPPKKVERRAVKLE
jgi:hypothetical protein